VHPRMLLCTRGCVCGIFDSQPTPAGHHASMRFAQHQAKPFLRVSVRLAQHQPFLAGVCALTRVLLPVPTGLVPTALFLP
jgi:hypothetical protein